eukprot:CAMPEP_0205889704 /NCGR_PEP_ID=MMETSP1083-20121108/21115_1 /ASSEMBLY_ACC=CAM_ASM_000430 /TAXON_ID=97485 /ORGANISM="Prymnesium parvum, Strain Texoma1" /LENGTH=31 /DNA_ID= /DNA_START= /DNA_END= /DNA_ORIENTATION=
MVVSMAQLALFVAGTLDAVDFSAASDDSSNT